eukprot:753216-Hanusia_phi.AAC.2
MFGWLPAGIVNVCSSQCHIINPPTPPVYVPVTPLPCNGRQEPLSHVLFLHSPLLPLPPPPPVSLSPSSPTGSPPRARFACAIRLLWFSVSHRGEEGHV